MGFQYNDNISTCFLCSRPFEYGSAKFNYHENYVCERCEFLRTIDKFDPVTYERKDNK